MTKNLFIILFLSVVAVIEAQEIVPISKSEVMAKVTEANLSLKISAQEFVEARADYRQTNAVFLPNITASHSGMTTTNPLMAFGAKLNQEILIQDDFNPNLLNNPAQTTNFATKFEIAQPLINVDGMYQRKAAKSKMQAMALQQDRASDKLVLEVEKAYMQLQLAYKGVSVIEKALKTALDHKKLAMDMFDQGYLQRADLLNVEVRVTEIKNQLQTAKSSVQNASNYLSFLMDDSSYVIYQPNDSLVKNELPIDLQKGVSSNRPDVKAMQLANQAFEAQHKSNKMTFLPRLNAFGSYELYDDKLFQGGANGFMIGAQLRWDLFQGASRFGKIQKSKASLEKSKLQYSQYLSQSKLEVHKAQRVLLDTENNLKLTYLALNQSKESLRIRADRFKEGLEKTSDLLMAEAQFAAKQLAYYQTIYEYNYARAYVHYLTKE